jgi:hypothetical protein
MTNMIPDNESAQGKDSVRSVRRGRAIMLLLLLIVALPTIIALVLVKSGWRPVGKDLSHGELLRPSRPLPELVLQDAAGHPAPTRALRGKWLLMLIEGRDCQESCRANLYKMQQVRLAQGKDMRRVERVVVLPESVSLETATVLGRDYPGLAVYRGSASAVSALTAVLHSTPLNQAGELLIVDPLGNVVLRYGANADATGIHKDLARLLRLSQVD